MEPLEIVFAVPLKCQLCVDDVSSALKTTAGVESFDVDLPAKLVTVHTTAAPSIVAQAIQNTGRDAIIRGTGKPNLAAVCILEQLSEAKTGNSIQGLARVVSASQSDSYIDITLNGVDKATYYPSIRVGGDISRGVESTGPELYRLDPVVADIRSEEAEGYFRGHALLHAPLPISNLIGRAIVILRLPIETDSLDLCGIIARSAGAWENDKQICSCSGKTVWEERADAKSKGISV